MVKAWHYDGQSGTRHDCELRPDSEGFSLANASGPLSSHSWSDLVYRGEKSVGPVYGHGTIQGWQLGFVDPIPPEIFERLPNPVKYGGFVDRIGFGPAAIAFTAVSAVVLYGALQAPSWLAPAIPMKWEKQLGDAMLGDLGGRFCKGPGSEAALKALVARIEPVGDKADVRIANIDMVNAVALPGGKVVIFKGLLKEAKSPDELAGVVGHEIGHVRKRHVMQSLLRQFGLSVVLGGIGGDAGGYMNTLISSSYSRDAEAEADSFSIGRLKSGQISPLATAAFFERLSKDEKKLGKAGAALGYISSHPVSESREKAFKYSYKQGKNYRSVLSDEQWKAILESCDKDPNVSKDDKLFF